ncbi:MAG: helix-turn-helix domain-containing protein [Anaerocolumna sp.]
MNILVVDDEYYIVQGITKNINWGEIGIDALYTAYSMKQAQEILLQQDIDILLTDIEMPKGSGLDLIAWVNENSYHPVKLLLTGHQNFEYAQKAILLQCFQYVLKPVEYGVLEEELKHAVEKVYENKNVYRAKNIAESWDSSKSLRMELFWQELFTRNISSSETSIADAMHRLNVPLSWLGEDFYFLLFDVHAKNISGEKENPIPLDEILAIVSDLICDKADTSIYKISSSEFLLAMISGIFPDYQHTFVFCEEILNKLCTALPAYRFSIYMSDKTPVSSVTDCYQLLKNFESSIFTTESIVIPVHTLSDLHTQEFSDSQMRKIPLSEWTELLLHYKSSLILENIKALFKDNFSYFPAKMLIAIYYGVLQTVFSVLESNAISINELFPKITHHTDLIKATSSIENFLFWAGHLLSDTEEILKVNADSASFVESVKKYIKAHLDSEDLNRNSIADAIHMNPDYISYLFHKQSGQLLSTYIKSERINAAKKLLITTDLSLQAIADSTGFSNSSYFHKQFKKTVGITPQQYRTKDSS